MTPSNSVRTMPFFDQVISGVMVVSPSMSEMEYSANISSLVKISIGETVNDSTTGGVLPIITDCWYQGDQSLPSLMRILTSQTCPLAVSTASIVEVTKPVSKPSTRHSISVSKMASFS